MTNPPQLIQASRVAEILSDWKAKYPEYVFPPESVSPEGKAARLARHVIDGIAADICKMMEEE